MDLVTILKLLKSKLWVLIVFPVLSIACAIFFVLKMERVYKSTAELSTGFTSDEYVKLSMDKTYNQYEVNTKFINTIESMKSLPVLSLVSYRLMLHDLESDVPFRKILNEKDLDFALSNAVIEDLKQFFKTQLEDITVLNSFEGNDHKMALSILKAYEYTPEDLSKKFSIYRKQLSDFIAVDFQSEDPLLSAFAVNTLCEEFLRFNRVLKTDRSTESVELLQKQLEEKRIAKDKKINELNAFRVSNDMYSYDAETASKLTQIATYEASKEAEEKNLTALTLSLNNVQSRLDGAQNTNQNEIAAINQRVIELRRRISNLSMNQDEESKMKVAQLRDELQLEISRLNNMTISGDGTQTEELLKEKNRLQLEIEISKSNLESVNQTLARLKSSISGFALKEAQLTELERDLQILTSEYQDAQERYNEALNKVSIIGASLKQTIKGLPAEKPESSKGIFIVAIAGIGSFSISVLAVLLLSVSNSAIRTPARLENLTGFKNIGILTETNLNPTKLIQAFHAKRKDDKVETFIHFLRKFRFEVQSSDKRLFLITSTRPMVGKSFVIINLAYSLSLLNKRVLIIDTNFKTSSLTKLLIPHAYGSTLLKKGFSNGYLLQRDTTNPDEPNETSEDEKPSNAHNGKSIIQRTVYKDVDIIGNFGGSDSPSEILAGKDFDKMLFNLLAEYDYILLEGASLNEYSDTRELIQYVDLVIPVFDANIVLNNLDLDSIKYLNGIKHKILGTALNNARIDDLSL